MRSDSVVIHAPSLDEQSGRPFANQTGIDLDAQTAPGEDVNDVQRPKAAAIAHQTVNVNDKIVSIH
jgi:hypothetical protein